MSTQYDRALSRLIVSVVACGVFIVMFVSQLGGGSNTGGVFAAPLLIIGLLGLLLSVIFFIVSAIQAFLYRNDAANKEKKKDA